MVKTEIRLAFAPRIGEFVGQVANLPFDRQVGNLPHELRPAFLN